MSEREVTSSQNCAEKVVCEPNFIVDSYVVYNLFNGKSEHRQLANNSRLEKYIFHKYKNGTIKFEYQEGWWAGSHYDGGNLRDDIPNEWFSLSWSEFLDLFCKKYPEHSYSYKRSELIDISDLRKFLGFK